MTFYILWHIPMNLCLFEVWTKSVKPMSELWLKICDETNWLSVSHTKCMWSHDIIKPYSTYFMLVLSIKRHLLEPSLIVSWNYVKKQVATSQPYYGLYLITSEIRLKSKCYMLRYRLVVDLLEVVGFVLMTPGRTDFM